MGVWRAVQQAGEAQDQVHESLNGRGGSHLATWPNCRGPLQAVNSSHVVLAWIVVVTAMRVSMLGFEVMSQYQRRLLSYSLRSFAKVFAAVTCDARVAQEINPTRQTSHRGGRVSEYLVVYR